MKGVSLRQAILQAWRERWPDYQWAINLKKLFPRTTSWDVQGLADHLLEQAMVGPAPNALIFSYLKYAINSQMVSYSSILLAITKFEDTSKELCMKTLLDLINNICPKLSCHGKAEECMGLCRALLSCLLWLLQCLSHCLERLRANAANAANPGGASSSAGVDNLLGPIAGALEKLLGTTKNRALLHIARLEEQSIWSVVEQTAWKVPECLIGVNIQDEVRTHLEDSILIIKGIPSLLTIHEEHSYKTEYPTVHALVTLEGTMNLTADGQPLMEHLLLVKKMQRIPMQYLLLEVWKACMVGLIEAQEGIEELKWTAFTFLKIPQVLLKLKKCYNGEKDFCEELNLAFEHLVKLTPLLDKADHRCNCDCLQLILQECNKLELLSDIHMKKLIGVRTTDREQVPQSKSPENSNVQPNPGLILRAEPTVTNILKTMDADHSKSPEGLLGVLGHMLSGKSLDLLLAAAAATGKLKSFARKFIKLHRLNEFAKHMSGEGTKASQVRALLFDISFLMLCHVTQIYGSEVITSDPSAGGELTFFESWMQLCMPEEGKSLNPEHGLRIDPSKVEALINHLNSSGEMKLVQVKWHEVCASLPGVVNEVLNAWEHGLLTMENVQKITDNLKGKMCSMAVCSVAWLVTHIRLLGLEEREKPLQLIQLLVSPIQGESTLQFYSERVIIMSSILERMCADVLQQTGMTVRFPGGAPSEGSPAPVTRELLPGARPVRELLSSTFSASMARGLLHTRALHALEASLHMGGLHWFTNNLVKELLQETRKESAETAVELLYSIFSLDMHQLTLSLLGHVLPPLLTSPAKWPLLTDPPGRALARLAVWCAITSYSVYNRSQTSARYRKRPREDIEDYVSLFPLDDTQPSKLLRLLSSNEEDPSILSSPGDRSMSSSLSAAQLHNINMKEPLNRVLANLFLLFSWSLTSKVAGPQTQFVQWFVEECVQCEQGSCTSILHFMPFTMVSELMKLPGMNNPKLILAITDLSLPLGRRVAAKGVAAVTLAL
ncbi:mediator of RNA polymerase II transcription subunit 24 isoform X2 [Petromyzon marinus]|nr:mediator of RNA polymerase II transcription subunit 24 isoform X2 [Petromyzon marinus]